MSGGADPDPLGSFETGYGSRGTRGIRGGKSAKRKREAYLKWQESEGQDRASIPIGHTGGQARLYILTGIGSLRTIKAILKSR